MSSRRRLGFSTPELLVVIVIMAIVVAYSGSFFSNFGAPGTDTAAKANLVAVSETQTTFLLRRGTPASLPELAAELPELVFTAGSSAGPALISAAVDNDVFTAAAASGKGSCWLLRLDGEPGAGEEPVVWAVADSGSCNATRAASLTPSGTAEGRSSDRPRTI